ncbi:MAG: hypothetical protein M5U12_18850 [Verrucomicrobia bacterium]|nr:hypothetical protein [Verrucomicrobiota bacterium]
MTATLLVWAGPKSTPVILEGRARQFEEFLVAVGAHGEPAPEDEHARGRLADLVVLEIVLVERGRRGDGGQAEEGEGEAAGQNTKHELAHERFDGCDRVSILRGQPLI